jgi:hypothetical protein
MLCAIGAGRLICSVRAATLMSKRKIQMVVIAFASALLLLWCYRLSRPGGDAEAKYKGWQRSIHRYSMAHSVERRLPAGLVRFLRIPGIEQKYLDEHEALGQALVASGYLTNVSIAVTNPASRRSQLAACLRKAFQGSGNEWEFYVRSNSEVVVTCLPEHVALCRQALHE